ncbi:hypothetical protein I2700191B6_04430 [Dorea formicigenerans]|uniref:hypothetical protein n=1 Tax=Dorea formicigenerans TaxID=39486 RepID=UPI0036F44339
MERVEEKIVIIGGLHHNTLGVIRSLGEEGIKSNNMIIVLSGKEIKKENIISKSKYIIKENIVYLQSDNDIVLWLLKHKKKLNSSCVICCSDGSAEVVIKNYKVLKDYYLLPGLSMNIEQLMDKSIQNELAQKVGMNIPKNIVVSVNQSVQWNLFPCITKPIKSIEGGGKADIHIINSSDELKEVLPTISAKHIEIQQYVDKQMEYQLIGCSLNAGETIIIPGFTTILRQPPNTNTGYLKYSPIKELNYDKKVVTDFIKEIGYSGLFSVEFIRDKEGIDYFLEINMRNDGNAYCVKCAGVNLPFIWCSSLLGKDIANLKKDIDKSVYFIPDFIDAKMGIESVGFFKWVYQFLAAKSHSLYNIRDMKPFLFEFKEYLNIYIKRFTHKITKN